MAVLDDFANHGELPEFLADILSKVKSRERVGSFGSLRCESHAEKIADPTLNNPQIAPSKLALPQNNKLMKTIITTFAIAALALIGAAPQAEARHSHSSRTYISGYDRYGAPIYTERYFIGYDRCGDPIWGKRIIRPQYRRPVRPVYVAPARHCAPRRYDRSYRGGTNIVIQGSFGGGW
jgi:hypothetical protein